MAEFTFNKPEWSTDPKPLDFKLVNQPLEEVTNKMILLLKNERRKPTNFYFLLWGLLTASSQTYHAIRKLVAKDPKYPTQAYVLGRPLIDTLFTVVALIEEPMCHSRKYELAGYKVEWEKYDRQLERYGDEPQWKSYLEEKKKYLNESAKLYVLSKDEKQNPAKHIAFWPIPSQMLKSNMISTEESRVFLKEVYDWRYRQISEWGHHAWGGMALGVFQTVPEHQWHPGKLESDAVYTGILFLLMILSEIEASCGYRAKQQLRYVWTILSNHFDEAAHYYDLRYQALL